LFFFFLSGFFSYLAKSKYKTPKIKSRKKNSDVATKLHYFSNEKQKIKTCSIQKIN